MTSVLGFTKTFRDQELILGFELTNSILDSTPVNLVLGLQHINLIMDFYSIKTF